MSSDKQKEAAAAKAMASAYSAIKAVFDQISNEFKLLDLMKAAGIKDGPQARMKTAAALWRDFKCTQVGAHHYNRRWRKP